ncbi:MAG: 4Fe-4S dicluster domain-containing protein [Desulfurococcales archaeon]|nr:4Fe-4S dicluster domain-containing protein [Desulfurococcales archaeon]
MAGTNIVWIHHFWHTEDLEPIVYILATLAVIGILYGFYKHYKLWTYGGQKIPFNQLGKRTWNLVKYALLQYKVIMKPWAGTIHLLIYLGMAWLLIATLLRAVDLHVVNILTGDVYKTYKLLNNLAGLSVIVGSILAIIRRASGQDNLPQDKVYYVIHLSFLTIATTGLFLTGMNDAGYRIAEGASSPYFDPVGYLIGKWMLGVSTSTLILAYRITWVTHLTIVMATLATLPWTNLWHILAGSANVAYTRESMVDFVEIEDIEKKVDEGETFGIVKLADTSWKQRMDYDACTSCMRCTNACPAFNGGKPLSPRDLLITMRNLMLEGKWDDKVIGDDEGKIHPDTVWSCVTCGACIYQCPVLNNHVDTILNLRRGLVSEYSILESEEAEKAIPEDARNALYNMMQMGNPFGFNPADREDWINELAGKFGDDIIAQPDEEYDYLYWIGCVTSYDPRIRPVAESLIKILKKVGYKVGVITDEACCGEPARRMGDEFLFSETAKQNQEILGQYKFKKLLVSCPHGYHVFKNEYRKYGINLEVEHHSILLARLIKEGKIKPSKEVRIALTYHDPCYLGRWNGHFDEPRAVIKSIPGVELKEMPRNRENSFCCGGGGGQMFYEIKQGERLATIRAKEASETGAKVVAVACPYCNTMFRAEVDQFGMEVKDIAEILAESLEDAGGESGSQ